MSAIWSDEAKLRRWLDVELAALEGGPRPVSCRSVRSSRSGASGAAERRAGGGDRGAHAHDVAAFVDAVAEQLGEALVPLRPHLVGRARHRARSRSATPARSCWRGSSAHSQRRRRAEEHRETITIGRTASTRSRPRSGSSSPAGRSRSSATGSEWRARWRIRVGKLSGAVGTYAAADPEVEQVACERLGLEPAPARRRSFSATGTPRC